MLLQIGFQFFVMSVTIQFSCLVTRTKYAVIHRDTTLSIFQNIMHIMLKYLFHSCKYILFNSKVSLQFVTSTFKSIFTIIIHINAYKYNIQLKKFEGFLGIIRYFNNLASILTCYVSIQVSELNDTLLCAGFITKWEALSQNLH